MNKEMRGLNPTDVFSFFDDICSVPHPSGNLDRIADYLVSFAEERALDYKRDEKNNVIIYKCASSDCRSINPVILQAHIDMVPSSEEYVKIDFNTDPIRTFVDGDYIRTYGTTLGGDDGIGAAMMLAVLDDDTLSHPPIEALFTADEEVGMLGALALDTSALNGKKMINLDHELEGQLICGCAGGADVHCSVPIKREDRTGNTAEIKISGLTGGHSGLTINEGRANANILMTRLLLALKKEVDFGLISMQGGTKETAIPSECVVRISAYPTVFGIIGDVVNRMQNVFKKEYNALEGGLSISLQEGDFGSESVLSESGLDSVLKVLAIIPNGAFERIPYLPNVVQSSSNLGVLNLAKNNLFFTCCVRGSVKSLLDWNCKKIEYILNGFGGTAYVDSSYPSWTFNKNSELQEIAKEAYRTVFGKEIDVTAVHAGLECGIFCEKIDGLDVISLGPDVTGVHTPYEHLSISSVERTYRFLKEILKNV